MRFASGLSFDLLLAAWLDSTNPPEEPSEPVPPQHAAALLEEPVDKQGAGARHPVAWSQSSV